MIQIIVSRDGEVLARGVFHGEPIGIGRSPDNAIQIDDACFSRHHARVEPAGAGWTIRDLGSTNGVTRGGQRLAEWAINDGDEVSIGDYRLTFTLTRTTTTATTCCRPRSRERPRRPSTRRSSRRRAPAPIRRSASAAATCAAS